ncbi:MAG: hypothetical protein K0U78_20055 [Actinomycetia bacterium]|nr:hypothetical protein [Actinomycetes bacterium]
MPQLILHSLRGFPVTDLAAHLPMQLTLGGRLRASVSGRFWYCRVEPPVACELGEDVQRDHIHPDLLTTGETTLNLEAVVITPVSSNRVLAPGIKDLPVHIAAVLDPVIRTSGFLDLDKVGYLGCAIVDEFVDGMDDPGAQLRDAIASAVPEQIRSG